MRKLVFLSCLTVGLSAGFVACSSDPVTPAVDSGADTGTPQDSGKDTATTDSGGQDTGTPDTGVDAGPQPVNGCTVFVDRTAADSGTAIVTGPAPTAVPAQYSPNCIKIKVGASVTFNSGFVDHPLTPSGGDTPNPITSTVMGTTQNFTFPKAGTYGFACGFHGSTMFGAVQVVPDRL